MIFLSHIFSAIAGALAAKFLGRERMSAPAAEKFSFLNFIAGFFRSLDFVFWGLVGFACLFFLSIHFDILKAVDFVGVLRPKVALFSFLSGFFVDLILLRVLKASQAKGFLTKKLHIPPQSIRFKPERLVSGEKAEFFITVHNQGLIPLAPGSFGIKLYANGEDIGVARCQNILIPGRYVELGPIDWKVKGRNMNFKAVIVEFKEGKGGKESYVETGNSAEKSSSAQVNKARLVIESLNIDPAYPGSGDSVFIGAKVKNAGEIQAPGETYAIEFFINDEKTKEFPGIDLEAGKDLSMGARSWIAAPGRHMIKAVLSPREDDEKVEFINEFQQRQLEVRSPACLKIASFIAVADGKIYEAPTEIDMLKGKNIHFAISLFNSGQEDAGPNDYRLSIFGINVNLPRTLVKANDFNADPLEFDWRAKSSGLVEIGAVLSDVADEKTIEIHEERRSFVVSTTSEPELKLSGIGLKGGYIKGGQEAFIGLALDNHGDMKAKSRDYFVRVKVDGEELGIFQGPEIPGHYENYPMEASDPWIAIEGEHTISADLYYKQKFINSVSDRIKIEPYPNIQLSIEKLSITPQPAHSGEKIVFEADVKGREKIDYGHRLANSFYIDSLKIGDLPIRESDGLKVEKVSDKWYKLKFERSVDPGEYDLSLELSYLVYKVQDKKGVSRLPYKGEWTKASKSLKFTVDHAPAVLSLSSIAVPDGMITGRDQWFSLKLKSSGDGAVRGGDLKITDTFSGKKIHEVFTGSVWAKSEREVRGVISTDKLYAGEHSWRFSVSNIKKIGDDLDQSITYPNPVVKKFTIHDKVLLDELLHLESYGVFISAARGRAKVFPALARAFGYLQSPDRYQESLDDSQDDCLEVARKAMEELANVDGLVT
ncbi:hypothetical protein GF382_01230, partial [Candidatus Falkowbacteria bacterium]|nr:hypothetical protein [Candidatus Falkowbacteria bacterium]